MPKNFGGRPGVLAELYGEGSCPDCAYGQQEDDSGMLYRCLTCWGTGRVPYPAAFPNKRKDADA